MVANMDTSNQINSNEIKIKYFATVAMLLKLYSNATQKHRYKLQYLRFPEYVKNNWYQIAEKNIIKNKQKLHANQKVISLYDYTCTYTVEHHS